MKPVQPAVQHRPGGPRGRRRRSRAAIVMIALLAITVVATAVSIAIGSTTIPLGTVLGAIFGGLDSDQATVVTSQRVPRTVLALVCGGALGAAGALMQGHTRNPLADPGLFGVNAGAAFGVVLVVYTAGITSSGVLLTAALLGALAATTVVFGIVLAGRGNTPVTMALTGATVGAILTAATTAIILLDRESLDVMRYWTIGSVQPRDVAMIRPVLVLVAIGLVLAMLNARAVTILGMGDETARSLGYRVRGQRVLGILAITILAGAATAACGSIGFVGLVVPHVVRRFVGGDYALLVPLSVLAGAALVTICDVIGRVALPSGELQVGLTLALVGGPVLIGLLARRRNLVL